MNVFLPNNLITTRDEQACMCSVRTWTQTFASIPPKNISNKYILQKGFVWITESVGPSKYKNSNHIKTNGTPEIKYSLAGMPTCKAHVWS